MEQQGKVANPARGQLNRENQYFPVPVRAWEFGLARRVQPSRSASAVSRNKKVCVRACLFAQNTSDVLLL